MRPLQDNDVFHAIAHPARRHLDEHLRQFRPRRRTGEQRHVLDQSAVLRRTNDEIDPCRTAGEATVNVVLAVADHHY